MVMKFCNALMMSSLLAVTVVTACDGDDTVAPATDASVDARVPEADAGKDTGLQQDAEAGRPRGNAAKLHFANDNITILDGFRYCLLASDGSKEPTKADVVDAPAFPTTKAKDSSKAGLATGHVSLAPDIVESYASKRIKVVAYFVESLEAFGASNDSCAKLMGKSAFKTADAGLVDAGVTDLLEDTDFNVVGDFPSGTFLDKQSYVMIQTGCAKGTPVGLQQRCVAFTGSESTLKVYPVALDGTASTTTGKNTTQVIHGAARLLTLSTGAEPVLNFFIKYPGSAAEESVMNVEYDNKGKAQPVPPKEVANIKNAGVVTISLTGGDVTDSLARALDVSEVTMADLVDKVGFTWVVMGTPAANKELSPGVRNHIYLHAALVPNN